MFGLLLRTTPKSSSLGNTRQEAGACASLQANIDLAIGRGKTHDAGMLEFVFFGFIFLTILVFVLAYWPKRTRAPASPPPAKAVQTGPAAQRVALVIGNSAYKAAGPLRNPANDAALLAGSLSRLGFEVVEKHDLGAEEMRSVLRSFEDRATGAEWALVYYSGHGMELNGKNWLLPVDVALARSSDLPDEAISADRVLERLSGVKKLRMVILDACRTSPLIARMAMNKGITRTVPQGLAPVEPSHGEVVFYAARHGHIALDGTGANSPFALALVKHMDEDGVEIGRFFRKVTSSVLAATNDGQEPFVYGRIPDEDFYFKPPLAVAARSDVQPASS